MTLQKQSRQRRISMRKVAEALILSDDVKRIPGAPPEE